MNQAQFVCFFDNINMYPFGDQKCSMSFFIKGADNKLVNMEESIKNLIIKSISNRNLDPQPSNLSYTGSDFLRTYMIKTWLMDTKLEHEEVNMGRQIVVSVILVRNTFGVIMVAYVPTLLMNIINQATTYIRIYEKYELIITVNITCMMVLTSVYLSVANSLPATLRFQILGSNIFNIFSTELTHQHQTHRGLASF